MIKILFYHSANQIALTEHKPPLCFPLIQDLLFLCILIHNYSKSNEHIFTAFYMVWAVYSIKYEIRSYS